MWKKLCHSRKTAMQCVREKNCAYRNEKGKIQKWCKENYFSTFRQKINRVITYSMHTNA